LNPGWILAALGVFIVIFCIGQLFNPYLLRVEDKAYLDSLASGPDDAARSDDGAAAPGALTPQASESKELVETPSR
jgi:hypothetical protein